MRSRLLLFVLLLPIAAGAQTYRESTLVSFSSFNDGPVLPSGGLIIDMTGHLYGSSQGGAHNLGAIFRVTPEGMVSVLHSFNGNDGSYPEVNPIRDQAGNLYGTTSQGGADADCSCGTVFKLTSAGEFTSLHSFTGGYAYPGALTLDAAGNLYGFEYATNTNGSIFKITREGTFSVVYDFCSLSSCADGSAPIGSLILNKAGNLYGTTNRGGQFNQGTVFELTPEYVETVLYSFTGGQDGANPIGKLTQDAAGNMYGVTYAGGSTSAAYGTVFKITPAGVESVLYNFCQSESCMDGARPLGSVVLDSFGDLYGTTILGGTHDAGVVFKVTPTGIESVQQDLTISADGGNGAVLDRAGDVYVEIYSGGKTGQGSVVKLAKRGDSPVR